VNEAKSDTIQLFVNGEQLAEFIVDRMSVQITRHEVLIRGECRDTYADKVLLDSDALERLGYQPDGSDLPEPVPLHQSYWSRLRRWMRVGEEKQQ
jgi:hypothetical protein